MKLVSLPDGKFIHKAAPDAWLTIGKVYSILREVSNCFVVEANNGDQVLVLKTRFQE